MYRYDPIFRELNLMIIQSTAFHAALNPLWLTELSLWKVTVILLLLLVMGAGLVEPQYFFLETRT